MDRLNSTTKRTGAATAGPGAVAVTGTVHGGISLGSSPVARSAYRQQVRRIAPEILLGRDEELAVLAEFCQADSGHPYLWWQAPAWAGKSALTSWFVLNAPETIRVISFFITARFAGHNDRMAFVDVVLEQLATAACEPLPAFLTEATKEAHLLEMLDTAAEACARQGQRLVLIVDGLDEDQGVTTGPDAYSIAALLPVRPAANIRVVVTGRPNPPVPPDVPDGHPLREHAIVRWLEVSPHAQVIRADAERELKRLLHGRPEEQDLLGLVAAAGGGLSTQDLAELTGWSVWQAEQHMRAVSGRTFTRRANRWRPGSGPEVYVLAHEELQSTAVEWLGTAGLADYRERLHRWSDGYRTRGWPAETPEYLLRGYFLLLQTVGDHGRMLTCALDQVRHDRMLDVTGGDAAALSEIITVQHALSDASEPDLAALLKLAVARERLASRNAHLPLGLPALWARLGDLGRAEALARSMVEPARQAEAFSLLLRAAAGAEDTSWLAEQGEAATHLVTDPYRQAQALVELVEAITAAGDFDRAERLIRTIEDPYRQAQTLVELVSVIAATGDFDRAERLIRTIDSPNRRAQAMTSLVRAIAASGELRRAEELARSLADPVWLARALIDLVAHGGERDELPLIAEQAVTALHDGGPEERVRLAAALASAGDIGAAKAFAMTASSLHLRVRGLVAVLRAAPSEDLEYLDKLAAEAMCLAGADPSAQWRATELAVTVSRAERLKAARTSDSAEWRARELAELAVAAAGRCSTGLVGEIADKAMSDPGTRLQSEERIELAVALSFIGDHERATLLLDSIHDPEVQIAILIRQLVATDEVGTGLGTRSEADTDRLSRGEALISRIPDEAQQARLLVELAEAAIRRGLRDHARRLGERAESLARSIVVTDWHARERVEHALVRAALAMNDLRRAADLTRRGHALIALLEAAAGDEHATRRLARAVESLARSLTAPQQQTEMLGALMQALVGRGEADRALAVIRWFTDPRAQARALTELLSLVLARGDRPMTQAVVSYGVAAVRSIASREQRADAMIEMVRAAVAAGDFSWARELAWRAEQMARWIIEPALRAQALTALVGVVASGGEQALTARLTSRAEAAIDAVPHPSQRADLQSGLMDALAGIARPAGTPLLDAEPYEYTEVGRTEPARFEATAADPHLPDSFAHHLGPEDRVTLLLDLMSRDPSQARHLAGRAEAAIRELSHPSRQAELLITYARVLAVAGDWDRAEAAARTIPDAPLRARALAVVAAHAEPTRARRLTAAVLGTEAWTTALDVLARLEPATLAAAADSLLRRR
ncbi:hypothetical protein [Nonomuraea sp. PA05]|uniref:hypothetical protein n=1 Tax=Nonomuraea sp. PA05 TaxID=2604466 RepID=UPI00165268D8|nr:hypothetical protein [Nonomuraea sp. PA05]